MQAKFSKLGFSTVIITSTLLFSCGDKINSQNNSEDTSTETMTSTDILTPPMAAKVPQKLEEHGQTRIDNYYWLRDDSRTKPEMLAYLNAENDYVNKSLAHTDELQTKIYKEIRGRIKEDDASVPYKYQNYWYYTRYEEGKEYPIYARKKETLEGKEEILLNGNERAEGNDFYSGRTSISEGENMMAFAEDTTGRRQYTVRFKNLATGEVLAETLKNVEAAMVWANDDKTIFYVKKDPETLRSHQVWSHTLGTNPETDKLIYEEKDESYYTYIGKSKSNKYIMIYLSSTLNTEVHLIDADKPTSKPTVFLKREAKHEYSIEHQDDHFYIVTNWDAQNFRLMKVKVGQQNDKKNWEEVIAHREDVLLEDIEVFNDFMVLSERKEGLLQLRVRNQKDNSEHYIEFEDPAYMAYTSQNVEFDTKNLRFGYTSMTTPNSVYDYDMQTKEKTLKKQQEVVGGYEVTNFVSERIYATAKDGTKIPISLVYKKGTQKDGKNPLVVYGYGSYGASMDAYFSVSRLSLLERGFVYAIVHIRGGEEMGRQWYEDGKLLKKKNTFEDFIACTEFLQSEGFGSPKTTFAAGGSAGGLLVGAVANMRPELYKGILAAVPFVDVVTTMLDESIPLTTNEFDEWGNPKNKEYYDYMMTYSPYDNVEAKEYPNFLITTGLHDSQVQYWEPAKWVAKLRELKTDKNKLYFKTNMDAGHGGASGRFEAIKETALEYAFMLDLMGKN
ncbi:protease II [Bernardetia litoralis DSM 6794]|uniref:Proline-specific endopeptidase n=1 Tax=Bernardetia litoralis (strain ATCC 23117 / DSM 6794 / NBRC 15988 / NCIMB 1366 / Fx l1 / Sio-4) TaxID=880071 RepID=I4AF64_BERLS|nr:oligopeptidase B [Bernardetia litoralis]AFM02599.1 protease II [Bernardetia litoralis DSM 6794]